MDLIKRKDAALQWAYDGLPLYTSYLDRNPRCAGRRSDKRYGDSPACVYPWSLPDVPPGFAVKTMSTKDCW
jgi:hypothetical protein